MKAKKKIVRLIMILIVSISIFSCSDGEDGAIGPAGPAGADGVDGTNGQDGENGEPGTANVIYSEWIENGFAPGSGTGVTSVDFDIKAPEITESVLDQGVVLVFARTLTEVAEEVEIDVFQLPHTFHSVNVQYRHRIEFNPPTVATEKPIAIIKIQAVSTNGTNLNGVINRFNQYRYVIIPGGTPLASASVSGKSLSVDYSKMSYEEIKTQFNISE